MKAIVRFKTFSRIILFLSVILNISFTGTVNCQTDSSEEKVLEDTSAQIFYSQSEQLRQLADSLGKAEIIKNKEKQIHSQQIVLISEIGKVIFKVSDYIKEVDTISINQSLDQIDSEYKIASNGINNNINFVTERNLSTTSLLLKGLQIRLDSRKKEVEKNIEELEKYRKTIDSLQNDTINYKFAKDSTLLTEYFNKLLEVSKTMDPIDKSLTRIIKDMHTTLNRINILSSNISGTNQEILNTRKYQSQNIFYRDSRNLWDNGHDEITISESLNYSYSKVSLLLKYYAINNLWKLNLMFLGFVTLITLIYKTRKKYIGLKINVVSEESKLILNYPLLSSAFICLIIFEFLFTHPPVLFQGIIWILSSLMLTVIIWNYLKKFQRFYFLYLFISFVIILLSDLLLKVSTADRWILLIVTVSGLVVGVLFIKNNILNKRNRTVKIVILIISLILLGVSVFSNLFGRFDLTKTLLTVSFFMLISAYLLYWGMILTIELLNIFTTVHESGGNENFRTRMGRLKNRTPSFLKILLIGGWLILIARNFYIYEYFMDELVIFLKEEITVGNFIFTPEKILIFILILVLSTLLSKILSFFADSTDNSKYKNENRVGLSNWMLLIRIALMSAGILLAFAATGIALDKMTIIIGALGVGIGLGLQSLVNNLISGVLLAFEKPFQVGDFIEIGDESGRIKEIGIRSSKLYTSEGSEIIIPNGDLLSKHVINWNRKATNKRSELILNFNSSINKIEIKKKLQEIINSNPDIHKNMPVNIFLDNFTDSSSEFKLTYWTDIGKLESVKSAIMLNVTEKFYKPPIVGESKS